MLWRRLKNLRNLILTRQHNDSKVIQAIAQQIAGGFWIKKLDWCPTNP
jgi:hypothetical protein